MALVLQCQNPVSPSSQVLLATPPDTVQVLHDSTEKGSCDSTPQARAPIPGDPAHLVMAAAENMTPTSGASHRKEEKFHVVTHGRCTGVFNDW
jgi:hypothetical protein